MAYNIFNIKILKSKILYDIIKVYKVLFYFYDTDGDKRWHEVIEVTDKSSPQTLAAVIYSEGKRIGANTMQHFKKRGEQLAVDFTKSYAVVRA